MHFENRGGREELTLCFEHVLRSGLYVGCIAAAGQPEDGKVRMKRLRVRT